MPKLIFEYGGKIYAYQFSNYITIGRRKKSDIVINIPQVKDEQCEIIMDDDGDYILFDYHDNGTIVDGKVVSEALLSENSIIQLGKIKMTFILDDSHHIHAEDNHSLITTKITHKDLKKVKKTRPKAICIDCRTRMFIKEMIKCKFCGELVCKSCEEYGACNKCDMERRF
ncbi:MAG: FHA domain-containing protein [Candidatus Helarchaeota archaeon]